MIGGEDGNEKSVGGLE